MKALLFLLLLLVGQTMILAQRDADPDSLRRLLGVYSTDDSRHIQTKVNLANYFVYNDLDSATVYIDQVLAYPDVDKKLPTGYALHYLVKAWTYHGRMMLKESKKWYFKSLAAAKSGSDMAQVREVELNLAALLVELQAPEARSVAETIIRRVENLQTREDKAHWLFGKFFILKINEYEDKLFDALDILQDEKVVAVAAEIPEYQFIIYNSKAVILSRMGNETLAIEHYKKALNLPTIEKFERKDLLQNIAASFIDLQQPDSCLLYLAYSKSVATFTENEQWTYAFNSSGALRMKGQTAAASRYIDTAIVVAQVMDNSNYIYRSMLKKAELCADVQDWGCTAQWLDAAQPYRAEVNLLEANTLDALLKLKLGIAKTMPTLLPELDTFLVRNRQYTSLMNDKQLKQVIYQYEVKQKEQENTLLRQELDIERQRKRNRNLWLWLLGVTAASMIGLALFWRRNTLLTRAYNGMLEEANAQLATDNAALLARLDTFSSNPNPTVGETALMLEEIIQFRTKDRMMVHLKCGEIEYIEQEKDHSWVVPTDTSRKFQTRSTLGKMEQLLSPFSVFAKAQQSYLVNVNHIVELNATRVRMRSGKEITLGKNSAESLHRAYEGWRQRTPSEMGG